jgi:hypothetical protein
MPAEFVRKLIRDFPPLREPAGAVERWEGAAEDAQWDGWKSHDVLGKDFGDPRLGTVALYSKLPPRQVDSFVSSVRAAYGKGKPEFMVGVYSKPTQESDGKHFVRLILVAHNRVGLTAAVQRWLSPTTPGDLRKS